MATVILSAVGTYFGGPIGSAIGAVIGQQIDRAIIGKGKAREGPRIKELDIQTSSYGTQVPAIFGAMRVAGTVIWSTDLIERRAKTSGGKNSPATINYSYSASFAVALSSRPIARIGRIWADGNLLRGAAGDFKSETLFRFYTGHGDQPVDPLLGSAEVSGQSPAYRGLAYVVFEEFQLADFGNRIPSLSFEIFERETPVPLMDIASIASAGAVTGSSTAMLTGFSVQGGDCRTALLPLLSILPVIARPEGDSIALADWHTHAVDHALNDAAVADGNERLDRPVRSRASKSIAPASLSIRHYEPQRDFQAGIQTSRVIGNARNAIQIDLPASLDSNAARALANANLLQMWRGLNGLKTSMPYQGNAMKVGDWVVPQDGSARLRITEVEYQRGTTRLSAQEWITDRLDIPGADPGRNLPDSDLAVGQTHLMVTELPATGSEDPGRAVIVAGAAGTGGAWRRASLSLVDGDRHVELGGTNGIATIGNTIGLIPAHSAQLVDRNNQPVIRLLHSAMTLPVGSGSPLSFDAPMLWIDGEIIRYGNADKIGPQDYRLSGLLRGCFGTRSNTPHADQSDTMILDANTLLVLDAFPTPIDASLVIHALGMGDTIAVEKMITVAGDAIRPRMPVHGTIMHQSDGGLRAEWKRRDRLVSVWADGTDVTNSEGAEEYVVELFVNALPANVWTVSAPHLSITPVELSELLISPGAILRFSIVQQGRFARSLPLSIDGHA